MSNGIFRIEYKTLGDGSGKGVFCLELEDADNPYTLPQIKGMLQAFIKDVNATHTEEGLLDYLNKQGVHARKPEEVYEVKITNPSKIDIRRT